MKLSILPFSFLFSSTLCLIVVTIVAYRYSSQSCHTDTCNIGPAQNAQDYIPVVFVTIAATFLYFIFLSNQSGTAFSEYERMCAEYREKREQMKSREEGKSMMSNKEAKKPSLMKIKYGTDNFRVIAANRSAGNYQEQLIPFLISLYIYATFVDVASAAKIGWGWIAFRSYYNIVFKLPFPALLFSTLPAYTCIWYMLGYTIYFIAIGNAL
jgi:hypothetical protein